MSGGFHLNKPALCNASSLGNVFSSGYPYTFGEVITPSATAFTKGAWTLLGTSGQNTSALLLKLFAGFPGTSELLCSYDIGIGISGSQVVLIQDLTCSGNSQSSNGFHPVLIDIAVPPGTDIWARCATNVANPTGAYFASALCFDSEYDAAHCSAVDTLGFSDTTLTGATVSCPNISKGAYSQIIGSTAEDYFGVYVGFDGQGATVNPYAIIDVAIGPSGSEQIILPDLLCMIGNAYGFYSECGVGPFPVNIPSGTRIAARGATVGGATQGYGVTIYGLR